MLRSSRRARKTSRIKRPFTAALVIGLLACQISPTQGEAAGKRGRKMLDLLSTPCAKHSSLRRRRHRLFNRCPMTHRSARLA